MVDTRRRQDFWQLRLCCYIYLLVVHKHWCSGRFVYHLLFPGLLPVGVSAYGQSVHTALEDVAADERDTRGVASREKDQK